MKVSSFENVKKINKNHQVSMKVIIFSDTMPNGSSIRQNMMNKK